MIVVVVLELPTSSFIVIYPTRFLFGEFISYKRCADGQTDRQTDGQTDICISRAAFAAEKEQKNFKALVGWVGKCSNNTCKHCNFILQQN